MHPIIAIVGRPNVGKSTLFNRFLGSRDAIIDSISGVTRDRHYGILEWNGRLFTVIDTGGYITDSKNQNKFLSEIQKQVVIAVKESDIVLFMVDVKSGIMDEDYQVAQLLREYQKPILLVVNKVDSVKYIPKTLEFYALGFECYYCISAISGSGSGELLDKLVTMLQKSYTQESCLETLPKIAIVGRPNVGKSTLMNTLLGEERHMVTDISGTTRDSIQVHYSRFGIKCILIDTAGIRKKSKVRETIEFYSVIRAIRAIENSDVCLLMIDAQRGYEVQDFNIFRFIEKNKKGVIILVNKWDLIEKDHHTHLVYEKIIKKNISNVKELPILFISSITKQRISKTLETALKVYKNRWKKIKTKCLNELMLPIIHATPPCSILHVDIKYCTQLPTKTPKFYFFTNKPKYIKENYKRFIENKLRKKIDFKGVPLTIYFKNK
ncbi:MAG: ribosome biogenesis GTPase Der [Candidatus Walczuchella monophlebidarum]